MTQKEPQRGLTPEELAVLKIKEDNILELLKGRRKEHALNSKDLEDMFNLKGPGVRKIISSLRRQHYPVCSGHPGYWWPTEQDDIDKTVRHLRSRAVKMLMTAHSIKNSFEKEKQLTMFEE